MFDLLAFPSGQVTGNKISVAWCPAKRKKHEQFAERVGFWGNGEEEAQPDERRKAGSVDDGEVID